MPDEKPTSSTPTLWKSVDEMADPSEMLKAISDAMAEYFKGDGEFRLDLADVKLRIYLDGPKWHGAVDKPVAEFVIQLETRLRKEFAKLNIPLPKMERGLLALEVKEGSWEAFLGFTAEAVGFFKTLTISYQTVAVGAVMATVGALANVRNRVHESISPAERQKAADLAVELNQQAAGAESDAIEQQIEPIPAGSLSEPDSPQPVGGSLNNEQLTALGKLEAIQGDAKELQKPILTLLSRMKQDDVVSLPGIEVPMKHAAAVETLERAARSPRRKKQTYYVDQHYLIENLETKQARSTWRVKIAYGGVSFWAKLALSEQDLKALTDEYNKSVDRGPSMDLRVNAEINATGKVDPATVIGIEKPRENNVGLSEAIRRAKNQPNS